MGDFTACQCQGDAGCPHHEKTPERVQVMPDGQSYPIPAHPRFVFDGEWRWLLPSGYTVSIRSLQNFQATRSGKREWENCCAVAACAWRRQARLHHNKSRMHSNPRLERNELHREAEIVLRAEIWEAALAKAEKGTR